MSSPDDKEDATRETALGERRALGFLALGAALLVCWIASPVAVGILFGALTGFLLEPLHVRLKPKLGEKWAAVASVAAATLVFAGALFGLGWLVVARARLMAYDLMGAVGPGGTAERAVSKLGVLTDKLGFAPQAITDKLRESAQKIAERSAELVTTVAAGSASAILGLFFAMLTMHFILLRWKEMSLMAQESLPLRPDYTRSLFEEFRTVGRTTLLGTIATGIAQGLFATVGFVIAGVPNPIFWGAMTSVASLVPAIGTMIVWVPAGIFLIASGHVGRGILELAWGLIFVIAVSDYVIRPRLVGGEEKMPSLVTFIALFGGVEVFGLKGLVMGPVLISLALAVLAIYQRETRQRRAGHVAPKTL